MCPVYSMVHKNLSDVYRTNLINVTGVIKENKLSGMLLVTSISRGMIMTGIVKYGQSDRIYTLIIQNGKNGIKWLH